MKKTIIFQLLILLLMIHNTSYAGPLKIYKCEEEPRCEETIIREKTYRTNNLFMSPFMVKIERYEKKGLEDFLSQSRKSQFSVKYLGHLERIFIFNSKQEKIKNLYICVEYYIYELPAKVKKKYNKNFSEELKKAECHATNIYKLRSILPLSKVLVLTPGNRFYSPSKKHERYDYFAINDSGNVQKISCNLEYAGYILSIFQGSKLLYQTTNNKRLKDKGLNKLTKELFDKYIVK